jgi:glycosyltransferase involved in cell wall biosynthesis
MRDPSPEAKPRSVSLVFPMFNEEAGAARAVRAGREALQGATSDWEILVVDDGSTDRTASIVVDLAREDPRVRLLRNETNQGLGGALRTGYGEATKELVLYTDADLPFDLKELPRAMRLLEEQGAEVLAGYRFDRTSEGLKRTVLTVVYTLLIRLVFRLRVRDVNFAFKLFRRTLLERIALKSSGSFIDAEFLLRARRAGARIVHIGVDYFPRTEGRSTLASPRVILGILFDMLRFFREL